MKSFTPALLILAVLLLPGAKAYAVQLEPAEIRLDDFLNSGFFTVTNESKGAQTYSLSWKTPPTGEIVRFAPRRVTLGAGESLPIHLLYRKPADLRDGEYRAELLITPEGGAERFEQTAANAEDLQARARPGPAVTLPVLVKAGAQHQAAPAP